MSYYDGEVKYDYVKVRILSCDKPTYWYADKVGQVIEAQRRTFIKPNGEIEAVTYWAKAGSASGKDIGYNGGLQDVKEVRP